MSELLMTPAPPETPPSPGVVVLGRFQPFHRGHALLLNAANQWRRQSAPDLTLIIAIGSSNRDESLQNPWSAEERSEMIQSWVSEMDIQNVLIVSIPDIEDPPNWVSHAEQYHGPAGVFSPAMHHLLNSIWMPDGKFRQHLLRTEIASKDGE